MTAFDPKQTYERSNLPLTMRFICILLFLLTGCSATAQTAKPLPVDPFERMQQELNGTCSYPILAKIQADKDLMCALDALRARCNKIDDCYVYCIGNDVGEHIAGGCTHVCNYGLRGKWEPAKKIAPGQAKKEK